MQADLQCDSSSWVLRVLSAVRACMPCMLGPALGPGKLPTTVQKCDRDRKGKRNSLGTYVDSRSKFLKHVIAPGRKRGPALLEMAICRRATVCRTDNRGRG